MTTTIDPEKIKRVTAWMVGTFKGHPDVDRIQLSQRTVRANGDQAYSPVYMWLRSDGAPEFIAGAVIDAATTDAEDTGGTCRYTVTAETAKGVIKARTDVRIGTAPASGDVSPEDSPTAAGLVQQAMRHQEAGQKLAIASVGTVFDLMERMLERQDKQIVRHQEREDRVFEMAERLSGADHDRKLEMMRAEQARDVRAKALEKLGPLVPIVAAKLLKLPAGAIAAMGLEAGAAVAAKHPIAGLPGGGPMPGVSQSVGTTGGASAAVGLSGAELGDGTSEADAFLLSFTADQLPIIASTLRPEQKQRLVALYRGAHERHEAAQRAAAAATQGESQQPAPEATT